MAAFRLPFVVAIFVLAVPSMTAPPSDNSLDVKKAASSNNRFSFDLMKYLMNSNENKDKNIFFSPYSISAALAMTSLGAAGKTLAEIDKTFYFDQVNTPSDDKAIHRAYKQLIELYNAANSNYSLSTANRLFGDNSFTVLPTFQENAKNYYQAELEQLDFKSGTAEGVINKWVEKQTHDKIKDLIAERSLADAVMVLVNAIYFKGTWKTQFEPKRTEKEDFHLNRNDKKKVDMMKLTSQFKYYHDDDLKAKVIEMPYSGDHLSMIVVLPDAIDGLTELVSKMDDTTFNSLVGKMSQQKVEVSFPKFKVETEYALKDTLEALGIKDLFSDSAQFSPLSEVPVKVSKVVHKAFVETDEQGTEAAAATTVELTLKSIPREPPLPPPTFNADQPFLFVISHLDTPFLLFTGLVLNPNETVSVGIAHVIGDGAASNAPVFQCSMWCWWLSAVMACFLPFANVYLRSSTS